MLILPVFFLGSSKTGLRTTLEQDKDTSLLEKKAALKAIDELKAGNLEAGKAATKARNDVEERGGGFDDAALRAADRPRFPRLSGRPIAPGPTAQVLGQKPARF